MLLYVLVPSDTSATNSIEVDGTFWSLQSFDLSSSSPEDRIPYSCISYTWGLGRQPSPLNPSFPISDRTIPALQIFSEHRPSGSGVWIDALCVPLTEPERIYAQADEIMVILSSTAQPALTRVLSSTSLSIEDLAVLEHEEWVERAWTYQEAVNGKPNAMLLTCEGSTSPLIPADRFFNSVGYALNHVKGTIADKLKLYPRLNAFEDVMADFWTAGYEERAALNIMSNMDRRVQGRAADHFYAMIGAITAEVVSGLEELDPSEAFMRICEKKGDFSFIYSAAERESVPGRRWRPVPGELPSILPWHGWGSSQPGRQCSEGLWLDEIAVLAPGEAREAAQQFVHHWLARFWKDTEQVEHNAEDSAYKALRVMGFTGSSQWITMAEGYFFPYKPVKAEKTLKILVSKALRWVMGAPGLVLFEDEGGKMAIYPGVFVGSVEGSDSVPILVGE
jgi:hypothetical protein